MRLIMPVQLVRFNRTNFKKRLFRAQSAKLIQSMKRLNQQARLKTQPADIKDFPCNLEEIASWPVSRVLYGLAPCGARTWRPFILGACCHAPHATYPDGEPETALEGFPSHRPYSVLLPVGFTVPLLLPVARWALTPPFHPYHDGSWRFAFCGTFPRVAPAGH